MQILEILLEFGVFIVAAIIAGAVSSYLLLTSYETDIQDSIKYEVPEDYFILLDEL